MAISGRVILEEAEAEIVILPHTSVILMPGQTMPLTIFRSNQISALRTLVTTTKTFGSIHVRYGILHVIKAAINQLV